MADGSNIVTIRDIDVPFFRIVTILIKWSIAAIPAAIIVAILYAAIFAILGGVTVGILDFIGVRRRNCRPRRHLSRQSRGPEPRSPYESVHLPAQSSAII